MPRKRFDYENYHPQFTKALNDLRHECPDLKSNWLEDALGISRVTLFNLKTGRTAVSKVTYLALQFAVLPEARKVQRERTRARLLYEKYYHDLAAGPFKAGARGLNEQPIGPDAERREEEFIKEHINPDKPAPEQSPDTLEANRLAAEKALKINAAKKKPRDFSLNDDEIEF